MTELTPEWIEYDEAQKKIDEMKKESEKYSTPENYAKYGKMQRQIVKLEKALPALKKKAEDSMLGSNEEEKKGDDDN